MITIYKNKKDIDNKTFVEMNDIFFNQMTSTEIDDRAVSIIKKIDDSDLETKYKIRSKFNDTLLDIDKLSTGCKTVLNVLYNPQIVFSIKECGDNALETIFNMEEGMVYSDYAMIPFEFERAKVVSENKEYIIDEYDELRDWWENED